MAEHVAPSGAISLEILAMGEGETAKFVEDKLRDRSLNKTVAELNKICLSGSSADKKLANKALRRLGFL
jgi:hypothetical protein